MTEQPPRTENQQATTALPFDIAVFDQLSDHLGSRKHAVDFLRSFTSLLEPRIRRIEQAFRGNNREELITALLSLRSSAAMAGANQILASTTRALTDGTTAPVGPLVRKLQGQAHLFRESTAHLREAHSADTAGMSRPEEQKRA